MYTINHESIYLLVERVPALGLKDELIQMFTSYGRILEWRYLDEYPCEEFHDAFWIKFAAFDNARCAKQHLDEKPFYGSLLRVSYAPQFESPTETLEKLRFRATMVLSVLQERSQLCAQFQSGHCARGDSCAHSHDKSVVPLRPFARKAVMSAGKSFDATMAAIRRKMEQVAPALPAPEEPLPAPAHSGGDRSDDTDHQEASKKFKRQ